MAKWYRISGIVGICFVFWLTQFLIHKQQTNMHDGFAMHDAFTIRRIELKKENTFELHGTYPSEMRQLRKVEEGNTFAIKLNKNTKRAYGFVASTKNHLYAALVNINRLRTWKIIDVDYVIFTNVRTSVPLNSDIRLVSYDRMLGPEGYYRESMTKLMFFNMTEYATIIYMDIDAIVLKSLDVLFSLPPVSLASPLAYWEDEPCFTSALLVITPDTKTWNALQNKIPFIVSQSKADMDLLNLFFQHKLGKHSKTFPGVLMLPGSFLTLSLHFREGIHGYNENREQKSVTLYPNLTELAKQTYIVHFSGGPKPWSMTESQIKHYDAISPHFFTFNLMFKKEFDIISKQLN